MPQVMVTIEGTRTPSVQLGTGERVTVLYTPEVQRRVDYGYVTIVNTITTYDDTECDGGVQDDAPKVDLPTPITVPSRGASREVWAEFVGGLVPPVDVDLTDPDVGRNDLVALWDQWVAEHNPETTE